MSDAIKIALPIDYKDQFFEMLNRSGFSFEDMLNLNNLDKTNVEKELLIYPINKSDISTCVEHGATDLGFISTDVLMECKPKSIDLLNFKIGQLYMGIMANKGFKDDVGSVLKVATRYPNFAMDYFLKQCRDVDIIEMNDVPEVSLNMNIADVVLDVLRPESVLTKHNLEVLDVIEPLSFHLISNIPFYHLKNDGILKVVNKLKSNVENV